MVVVFKDACLRFDKEIVAIAKELRHFFTSLKFDSSLIIINVIYWEVDNLVIIQISTYCFSKDCVIFILINMSTSKFSTTDDV